MIHFTDELSTDIVARERMLDRAMGRARVLKPSEILRRGRAPAEGLALVARERGKLVGSVRLWNVDAGGKPALLLGPLAVDPAAQGKGIGTGLMDLALFRAATLGHAGVILVGDQEYYERFGFSAERTAGLVMPAPVAQRRFLALEIQPQALADASGAIVATGALAPAVLREAA